MLRKLFRGPVTPRSRAEARPKVVKTAKSFSSTPAAEGRSQAPLLWGAGVVTSRVQGLGQ